MKRLFITLPILLLGITTIACPVCEKQQPKILKGITHGTGPQSNWDFVIIAFVVVLVIATLFFSLKFLFKPGEKSEQHIKNLFIN
ncbi:hypothetical protein [Pseudopedobacter beijingensis]|uniref:Cbb3-type cytochrome oxidase component FixQ n=1 Tax=Pseudopedobacter beijingensis TaxID=1207056 RepID=A0ABW4IDB2_9SPHI